MPKRKLCFFFFLINPNSGSKVQMKDGKKYHKYIPMKKKRKPNFTSVFTVLKLILILN